MIKIVPFIFTSLKLLTTQPVDFIVLAPKRNIDMNFNLDHRSTTFFFFFKSPNVVDRLSCIDWGPLTEAAAATYFSRVHQDKLDQL